MVDKYDINCIVDVRSNPFSRYYSDFNSNSLSNILKSRDKLYMSMKELGAKRFEEEVYSIENQVLFNRVYKTKAFQRGIERIHKGMDLGYKIVIMCSEKNPIECHRSIMIGRYLSDNGYDVQNILHNGTTISQKEVEETLIDKHKKELDSEFNLFSQKELSFTEKKELAYQFQEKEIAFIKGDEEDD